MCIRDRHVVASAVPPAGGSQGTGVSLIQENEIKVAISQPEKVNGLQVSGVNE